MVGEEDGMNKTVKTVVIISLVLALFVLWALRFTYYNGGGDSGVFFRVNHITGDVEIWNAGKGGVWMRWRTDQK